MRTRDVNRLEGGQERQYPRHPPPIFHSPFQQLVPAVCFLGTRRQNFRHEHERFEHFSFNPGPRESQRRGSRSNDKGPELRKRDDFLHPFLHSSPASAMSSSFFFCLTVPGFPVLNHHGYKP